MVDLPTTEIIEPENEMEIPNRWQERKMGI